jgi:hypothetical protein
VTTLDPSVLDVVEQHRTEWVVRVDGRWSRYGLLHGESPRWYFVKPNGNWWSITEFDTDESTRWCGESRASLVPAEEPFRLEDGPVATGELVHIAHAPPVVQMWVAGYRPDPAEVDALREHGGQQQDLAGWSA